LFAVLLAFLAPFLVGSTSDVHVVLFTYDATLAVATLVLVRRHGWPLLGPAALWLTWMTFASWYVNEYRPDMFVSAELYLTFVCASYLVMLELYRRAGDTASTAAAAALAIGPLLYHIASVDILFTHSVWLLVYLIVVSAIGVGFLAARSGPRLL